MTEKLKQNEKLNDNQVTKEGNNQEKTSNANGRVKRGFRHIREQKNNVNKNIESNKENIKKD